MKRTEHAWVRLLLGSVVPDKASRVMVWLSKSRRVAHEIPYGGRVVRLTITYDDGKPKKRRAKR